MTSPQAQLFLQTQFEDRPHYLSNFNHGEFNMPLRLRLCLRVRECLLILTLLLGCQLTARAATTFVVTNTDDAGSGSLRQAILDANANPGSDLITFNIGS